MTDKYKLRDEVEARTQRAEDELKHQHDLRQDYEAQLREYIPRMERLEDRNARLIELLESTKAQLKRTQEDRDDKREQVGRLSDLLNRCAKAVGLPVYEPGGFLILPREDVPRVVHECVRSEQVIAARLRDERNVLQAEVERLRSERKGTVGDIMITDTGKAVMSFVLPAWVNYAVVDGMVMPIRDGVPREESDGKDTLKQEYPVPVKPPGVYVTAHADATPLSESCNSDDAGNSDDGVDWDYIRLDLSSMIPPYPTVRDRQISHLARAVLRLRDRLDAMEKKNNDGGK